MHNLTPVEYLINILNNWTKFCEQHKPFADAITSVLLDNQKLIAENKRLKKQLKEMRNTDGKVN